MSILSKLSILLEKGQMAKPAGHLDIAHLSIDNAIKYMEHKGFDYKGFDYKKEMPDFAHNFKLAKEKAKKGWMVRKEMPVITSKDVAAFEKKLADDGVEVKNKKVSVGDLNPIQKQIYFDHVIDKVMEEGIEKAIHFVTNKSFIISDDMYIIDGHHRFLTGMLLAPDTKVSVLEVELPIKELLDEAHDFSEELGHEKNL